MSLFGFRDEGIMYRALPTVDAGGRGLTALSSAST
jgi:hypothetical protein